MFIAPLLLFQMNDLILKSNSVKWALLSHLNEETGIKRIYLSYLRLRG